MKDACDNIQNSGIERSLAVRIPGSTSNLGPGFDTLGLAVTIYNCVRFDLLERNDETVPLVRLIGDSESIDLPIDNTNHIYKVLTEYLPADCLSRVRITIDCAIPIGSGLGSSGTATLAALWASRLLKQYDADHDFLLHEATRFEGHPDNVCPSLLGGFNISAVAGPGRRVLVKPMPWPNDWELLFVVPARQLKTSQARSVLPRTVPMKDAVHNVQRVSLLLAAVAACDEELLEYAFDDKLHEPYRAELVPELGELRRLLKGKGALGCALSGAGPSVMAVANQREIERVHESVRVWAARQTPAPRVLKLGVDREGLRPL